MAPCRIPKGWSCRKEKCARLSCITERKPDIKFTSTMERNFVEVKVENQQVKCLVDSGANISCISQYLLHHVKSNAVIRKSKITSGIGVCAEVHSILGITTLELIDC